MKKYLFLLLPLTMSFSVKSQIMGGAEYIQNYAKMMTKKAKGPELKGSIYLNETPCSVTVMTKNGQGELKEAKLNMHTSAVDVTHEGVDSELLFQEYDYLVLNCNNLEKKYYAAPRYKVEGKPLTGFVEIFGDGDVKVMVNHYNYTRKANSDAKIIGGETDDRLIKKTKVFLVNKTKITEIDNKKDLIKLYPNKASEINEAFSKNLASFKTPETIMTLISSIMG
jgi:acylphosphatase